MLTKTSHHDAKQTQTILHPNAVTVLVLTMVVACQSSVFAQPITYNVQPYDLSNNYTIEGGFITTNGNLGQLSTSDILDYEIEVTGADGYTFSAVDAYFIISGEVIASARQIQIQYDMTQMTGGEFVLYESFRELVPGPGGFSTEWVDHDLSLSYSISQPQAGNPVSRAQYEHFAFGFIDVGALTDFPSQTPIVVAQVPEPTGFMFLLLGICVAGLAARRNHTFCDSGTLQATLN